MHIWWMLTFLILFFFSGRISLGQECPDRHPVIIVPGVGGSILEALFSLENDTLPHYICSKKQSDWKRLWVVGGDMVPEYDDCIVYYLTCEWDDDHGLMKSRRGVTVRTPDFGNTYAVENLDPGGLLTPFANYFSKFVEAFVDRGFEKGRTILAAPYDWRLAPSMEYFSQLSDLIVNASLSNGGKKVDIVTHSLGGTVSYYFLMLQSKAFKEKYIRNWITVSSPWAGSVTAIMTILSGYGFGLPVSPEKYAVAEKTFLCSYFLLPNQVVWNSTTVVTTTSSNYTCSLSDYSRLWSDAGVDHGYDLTKECLSVFDNYDFPSGIESLQCIYSKSLKTAEHLSYLAGFNHSPSIDYGDGDETVNLSSLEYACNLWKTKGISVNVTVIDDVKHMDTIEDRGIIDMILNMACS